MQKKLTNELKFYFKVSRKAGWGRDKAGNPIPVVMKYCLTSEEEPFVLNKRKGQLVKYVKRQIAKDMKIGERHLIRISDRRGYKVMEE